VSLREGEGFVPGELPIKERKEDEGEPYGVRRSIRHAAESGGDRVGKEIAAGAGE